MNEEAAWAIYKAERNPDSILAIPRYTAANGKQLQHEA
jgi:hypothetical protein